MELLVKKKLKNNPMKKYILFYFILFSCPVFSFGQDADVSNIFAGVEVGSKGVKLSVVRLNKNLEGDFSYSVLADSAINTEIIVSWGINESVKAVEELYYKALNFYKVPNKQIFLVVSSGVMQQAQLTNNLGKLETLKQEIKIRLAKKNKTIDFLTPEKEAKLVYLGTIHKEDRSGAVMLDVGSGNTKGGIFEQNGSFVNFDFSWGTAKIKTEVNKLQPVSIIDFNDQTKEFIKKVKYDYISPTFNQKPLIRNQNFMIMGGGICWVMVTLMKPENMDKAFIELTMNEVKKFKSLVLDNYENLIDENRVNSKEAKEEFKKVKRNFDQKSMIAGGALVEAIMDDLNSTSPAKSFYFSRYSSWLTGYIVLVVTKGFEEIDQQERR